jgi:hypothetical protein
MNSRAPTNTLVAIPWQGCCSHRVAALRWVLSRWLTFGHAVYVGTVPEPQWIKAKAVDAAVAATDDDILVVADADVWTDGVGEAVELVRAGAPWVVPHDILYRLTAEATASVYAGTALSSDLATDEEPYQGRAGGGMVVLRREVYDDCPLDPRFVGWGHEDEAWALALTRLYGKPARLDYPMWHLWHPPQPRITRGLGSEASEKLYRRYHKAARDADLMRALITEAKAESREEAPA